MVASPAVSTVVSAPLSLVGAGTQSHDGSGGSPISAGREALQARRARLREEIADARQQARQPSLLPGSAPGGDSEEAAGKFVAQRAAAEAMEAQLSANRTKLADVTSEEQDLSARQEELQQESAGLQHAFRAALDTPLQSAIYTIQQLLHENVDDHDTAKALSTVLKELTSANPYLPTFNFSGSDLADETRNWIASTFCDPDKHGGRSPTQGRGEDEKLKAAALSHVDPAIDKALQTLEFDHWEHEEADLGELVLHCFRRFDLLATFHIEEKTLRAFVKAVRAKYRPNPFHNFRHGFDVMQVVSALCAGVALRQLRPLEVLTMLITSLCIDLDHGGTNDRFLINSNSPLCQLYNGQFVNENHHCASTWRILAEPQTNILAGLTQEQWREARKLSVSLFLATAMSKHFDVITKLTSKCEAEQFTFSTQEDRLQLMSAIVHAADISSACRPMSMAQKWAALRMEEFWRQGDTEQALGLAISPMCGRIGGAQGSAGGANAAAAAAAGLEDAETAAGAAIAHMQVDYCDFLVAPMMNLLCMALGDSEPTIVEAQRYMKLNRSEWATQTNEMTGFTSELDTSTVVGIEITHTQPQGVEEAPSTETPEARKTTPLVEPTVKQNEKPGVESGCCVVS